ncbi:MAG: class I SAM-dependent methyltransferase [Verrucomicrobia bacterium]|jgi:SAM-dependent methyltransferase|nr:class I SAM-dependent methyltransferase [Verrucomicrobiota bacterium]
MGWRLKSAQFKLLSALPGGTGLYHYLQENVTRSTVASRVRVNQKINAGLDFWSWLQAPRRAEQLTGGRLLDYGSGWHPTIPLLWYALGTERQTLVDITPNMDAEKVSAAIRLVREVAGDPNWAGRASLKRLPEARPISGGPAAPALLPLGIEYCAPYGSVLRDRPEQYDLVICSQVMQHIPKPALATVVKEFFSCLKPGGLFHATIHFVGHFSDPSLRHGHYEHLIPSPETWESWINSSLMSFNRLKGPDYREVIEQAGFKFLEFKRTEPTAPDLAELKRTRVHPCFQHYSEQDLATLGVFLVAEKP